MAVPQRFASNTAFHHLLLYFLSLLQSGSCFPPIDTVKKVIKNPQPSLDGHRPVKTQNLKHWNCCWVSLFPAPTELRASSSLLQADTEASCQTDGNSMCFLHKENDTLSGRKRSWEHLYQQEQENLPTTEVSLHTRTVKCSRPLQFVLCLGAALRFLPTHTLQSSFLPPLPSSR